MSNAVVIKPFMMTVREQIEQEQREFEEGSKRLEEYRAHLPWYIKLPCAVGLHNWGSVYDVRPWTRTNLNSVFVKECYKCGRLEPR